jgi:hypothetical protein
MFTVVSDGPWLGHRIDLPAGSSVIGRAPANGIAVGDGTVGREHARVDVAGGRVQIVDLGSRNGTWVNDRPVSGPRELRDGDLVRLGSLVLRFTAPRSRSPVVKMLVFGLIATALGLAVDAAFDFLRKDWSNPVGIGLVAALTFASAMIPVLQLGAERRPRPASRLRWSVVATVLAVLLVCTGGAGGAAWAVQYAGGYITGHEAGTDLLAEPASATAGGLTLTVHAVLDTAHFTRVDLSGANARDDPVQLPVFHNCLLTARSGATLEADPFRSDWPEAVPPGGSVRGFVTFGGHLPADATEVSLSFLTVFVQGFGGPDSIAVRNIALRRPPLR